MVTFPLNDGQRRAAHTIEGPVLVSAGAGTGKTRALAERFVNAVAPGRIEGWAPARADEVLAITFTDKAAGEIAERIRASLKATGLTRCAREVDRAWISTIHGLCARVLRAFPLEAGVDPGFRVADETHAHELRAEAFDRAARSLCDTSREVQGLFALYGFDQVWGAVSAATRRLEAHGFSSGRMTVPPARDVRELLDEAFTLFSATEEALRPHMRPVTGAANHARACRDTLEMLEPAVRETIGEAEVAARLWMALSGYSARGGSAAAIKDVCETLADGRKRLLGETVELLTEVHARALVELIEAYRSELARTKRERGLLDYSDLQLRVVQLVTARPDVRRELRSRFRLVMVDEFQDTDALQLAIVEAVSGANLCTVGDERQSIYRFRGADVDVYRRHRRQMLTAGATPVELVGNYRSHRDVLAFVNQLFGAEQLFGSDLLRLESCRGEPDPPCVPGDTPRLMIDLVQAPGRSLSRAQSAEARALAERFAELRQLGVDPGGMVVLVRKYAHAAPVAAALRAAGFSVLVTGGRRFLGRPEVRMARALCRVIANPRDEQALVELLLSPMSAVSDDGVWLLRNADGGAGRERGMWDVLGDPEVPLDPDDAAAARLLRDVIVRARERAGSTGLGEVLLSAVEESGVDRVLLRGGDDGLQAFANVVRFARKADECERSGVAVGAAAFRVRIDSEERYGDQETPSAVSADGSSAVRVMSVHAAKGLEFPVVGVVMLGESAPRGQGVLETDVRDGRLELALALPSEWGGTPKSRRTRRFDELRARHGAAEADEAKRLLYVACTRAREALVMCGSGDFDAEPAPTGRSGLDLMRLALAPLFEGAAPGTDATRVLEDGTRVSVRMREIDDAGLAGERGAVREVPTAGASRGARRAVRAESHEPLREVREALEAARHPAPLRPERLSYSDIAAFEACPLRYWAQSVARLGDIASPDDAGPARFGSALHTLLQAHATACARDVEERSVALASYHRLGPDGAARLRDAALRLRNSGLEGELAAHRVVRREYPFSVRVSGEKHGFTLVGAVDAYGRTAEDALIVDYKSGTAAESQDALRARYARQAECYAYAVLREGCRRVKVVFARPEVPSADGEAELVQFVFGARDAARIERSLAAVYESIATEPYAPLPLRDDAVCRGCRVADSLCALMSRRGAG